MMFAIGFVIFILVIAEIQGRKLYNTLANFFVLQKVFFVLISLSLFPFIGVEGILLGYGLSFIPFFKRMYTSLKIKNYDFKFLKEKSGFIANNYSLDLTKSVKGQIDKLMIAPMFGFGLLGNYYLGRFYEETGEPKKAMSTYQSAYTLKEIAGITKDDVLEKADLIKADFGY